MKSESHPEQFEWSVLYSRNQNLSLGSAPQQQETMVFGCKGSNCSWPARYTGNCSSSSSCSYAHLLSSQIVATNEHIMLMWRRGTLSMPGSGSCCQGLTQGHQHRSTWWIDYRWNAWVMSCFCWGRSQGPCSRFSCERKILELKSPGQLSMRRCWPYAEAIHADLCCT